MSTLVVVAHPDDEVLGCGGVLAAFTRTGGRATACILCGNAEVRRFRPELEGLRAQTEAASRHLGLEPPIVGPFPNIALNAVPHVELVRFIEEAILATGATRIITHHPADLNNDHLHVSLAAQAAARLFQRGVNAKPLEELLFMEIASSTDWAIPSGMLPFRGDSYLEISEEDLTAKIEALACYEGVMREAPHPRRAEVIRAMAVCRGSEAGLKLAECFQTGFRRCERPR
jgi:LmbE family N-acetylglucosaminyl deacetylase